MVAITGGAGSGKSAIIRALKEKISVSPELAVKRFAWESIDSIVNDLYTKPSIKNTKFLKGVHDIFGTIDKKEVAKIAFGDLFKRKKLEYFSGSFVLDALQESIESAKNDNCDFYIIEFPLLVEMGLHSLFHLRVCVQADRGIRIKRIMTRDPHRSTAEIKNILDSQFSDSIRGLLCNHTAVNNGEADIVDCVDEIIEELYWEKKWG